METDQTAAEPVPGTDEVLVYERRTRQLVREPVLGDALLKFAYRSPGRSLLRWFLFRTALASRILGWYADTRWSRRKIRKTVAALGIDMDECREPVESFATFNEFFSRHLRADARPFDAHPDVLCSPADARVLVFPQLDGNTCMMIKGAPFTVCDLLRDPRDNTPDFAGGTVVVARLCPADYHRFHFPAAGCELRRWEIGGRLDSVNPLALATGVRVFAENRRVVTMLDLERFGPTAFVEVGAFGVAGIVQTHATREFGKMDEKGYFKFGGSTVVLVCGRGRVALDPDLVENSRAGYETRIRAGETLGRYSPTNCSA